MSMALFECPSSLFPIPPPWPEDLSRDDRAGEALALVSVSRCPQQSGRGQEFHLGLPGGPHPTASCPHAQEAVAERSVALSQELWEGRVLQQGSHVSQTTWPPPRGLSRRGLGVHVHSELLHETAELSRCLLTAAWPQVFCCCF